MNDIDKEVKSDAIQPKIAEPEIIEILEDSTVSNQIEVKTDSDNSYTVQRKDTMYSLSKKFNISVDELKTLNNLTENNLSIGQIIKIKK